MNEKRTAMTQEKMILELISLLMKNGMRDKANDIFEIVAYIDGLEKQLDHVMNELAGIKRQLADIQKQSLFREIKEGLSNSVVKAENQYNIMQQQFYEAKEEIRSRAAQIILQAEQKGKEALNKICIFFDIKEKLEEIRANVRESEKIVDRTISKIDMFGNGMRESLQKAANTFRLFADKKEMDYSQRGKKFSKTELLKRPWQIKKHILSDMELHLDAMIGKIAGKEVLPDVNPMIIENAGHQYGSEAFEAYQEQKDTVGSKDELLENIVQKMKINSR